MIRKAVLALALVLGLAVATPARAATVFTDAVGNTFVIGAFGQPVFIGPTVGVLVTTPPAVFVPVQQFAFVSRTRFVRGRRTVVKQKTVIRRR